MRRLLTMVLLLVSAGFAQTSFNFSDTTPAAPSGGVNCRWQKDASVPINFSCNIPTAAFAITGGPNSFGAFLNDFSLSTLKLPTGAGFTPSASSHIGYDTTAMNWLIYTLGGNKTLGLLSGAFTDAHCLQVSKIGNTLLIVDSGAVCGGGGGGGTWGSITGTLSSQTDLNTALGLRALDSLTVHLAGTETITGQKHFTVPPIIDGPPTISGTPQTVPSPTAGDGQLGIDAAGLAFFKEVIGGTTQASKRPAFGGSDCGAGQHVNGVDSTTFVLKCSADSGGMPTEVDGQIIYGVAAAWVTGTALPNGITATTQAPGDNSTKVATDAYVDAAVAAGIAGGSGWPAAPVTTHDIDTGTYNNDQAITVAGCSGGTKYFSTDGATVTAVSGTVAITATATNLDSRCEKTGYEKSARKRSTYTLTVATPTHSPDTSTITSGQAITIATITTGSPVLKYCTNVGADCDPTSGTTYTVPVTSITTTNTHLCSKGTKTGYNASATKCSVYTIAGGSITLGSAGHCNLHSTACAITGMTTSAGQDLVIPFTNFNGARTISSVLLSDGTTSCSQDGTTVTFAGNHPIYYFRCHNIPSGITGVTVTIDAADDIMGFAVPANSFAASPLNVQDTAGATGATTTIASGPMITTNAGDVVFGMLVDWNGGETFTQSGSWLIKDSSTNGAVGDAALVDQIPGSTGTFTPAVTASGSGTWFGAGISYHP